MSTHLNCPTDVVLIMSITLCSGGEIRKVLTHKAPSKICTRQHSKIFIFYFSEKTSLDISCESSAWQTNHMKCQDLFSSENKIKIKIVVCFSCD